MEEKQGFTSHISYGKMLTASLFILTGALLLARNMGILPNEWFDILVAWHSLFIIVGIYTIIRQRYVGGIFLLLIGVYLLSNHLLLFSYNADKMLWPLILAFIGLIILKPRSGKRRRAHRMAYHVHMAQKMANRRMGGAAEGEQQCQSEDGFLNSDNSFSAVRQVVLDEIFKGARIRTDFGGTTIDLRHTHLAPGETYIDVNCNLGGVELYIPTDWNVRIECNCFCGGCEDKRWKGMAPKEESSVLVIRGNISFGGLEIKD